MVQYDSWAEANGRERPRYGPPLRQARTMLPLPWLGFSRGPWSALRGIFGSELRWPEFSVPGPQKDPLQPFWIPALSRNDAKYLVLIISSTSVRSNYARVSRGPRSALRGIFGSELRRPPYQQETDAGNTGTGGGRNDSPVVTAIVVENPAHVNR